VQAGCWQGRTGGLLWLLSSSAIALL